MGQIKNALIRYRVIDKCLRNKYKPFPSKDQLRTACEDALFGSTEGESICDSTIEKDLFYLRMEHDAPIKYSKKNRGYYYESDTFSLDDIPLTEDDLMAIRFAASTLSQFKDVEMFKQFGFAIDKIADRVALKTSELAEDTTNFVQFETGTSVKGNEFLTPLLQGISSKKYVYFDYTSFQSENKSKSRKVVPFVLKEYRNRWYLVCFDCVKSKVVTYALDRMSNVELSDNIYSENISFDTKRFFQHAVGITVMEGAPEKVIFKAENIASKYIDSQPFHHSQQLVKEGKNKTTFELSVIISEELIRAFLSYAGDIEVIEPISLRNQLIKRAKDLLSKY
jgi:predicted DNA-binding transcriptional regulator YafY